MIGKRFRLLPFIFANYNFTLSEILDNYKAVNVHDENRINTVPVLPLVLLFSVQWKGLPSTTGTAVE